MKLEQEFLTREPRSGASIPLADCDLIRCASVATNETETEYLEIVYLCHFPIEVGIILEVTAATVPIVYSTMYSSLARQCRWN